MKNKLQVTSIIVSTLLLLSNTVSSQAVFNASYANFNFLAANKVHKVGTDGSAAGNVTLYTNVITVGAQQIDCIVRTVSITAGTFTLPGAAAAGTIPFDYSSATGTGMSANADRFFAPTFNFTAAGNCRFKFEFILGGSYNNGTNTGTAVILQNVYVNTYDIDGNGGANSNQYNEFSPYALVKLQTTGGNVTISNDAVTGLVKFRSNTATNSTVVTADATRVQVGYNAISTLDVIVGADGSGAAYFFLDFGFGVAWGVPPTTVLSLKWLSFTAKKGNGNTVNLNWSTAEENNVKGFTIQRSKNLYDWVTIGSASAKGSMATNYYEFNDPNPEENQNYYRIIQTDIDGKATFSSVVSISMKSTLGLNLNVFPNPAVSNFINVFLPQKSNVLIYNQLGSLVMSTNLSKGTHQIDISKLSKGVYQLKAGLESTQLLVQ